MKLAAGAIDNFIESQISGLDAALLYGPDAGLALIRKNKIISKILGDDYDEMLFSKFNADELSKEPGILIDEANAISLMPGRKFILIYNCPASFGKVIENALASKKSDCFILLLAGELAPSTGLRKFFEGKSDKIAALPCYADDEASIYRIAEQELREFNPNREILSYISHNLSGDRMVIKQELEKIKIYASNKNTLDFPVIENLLAGSSNSDFQDLVNAVASKNVERTCKLCEELLQTGIPAITLIRVIINYMQRILEVKTHMDSGQSFFEAIKNLRPPVFFKQKDILQRHVSNWQSAEVKQILLKLENLEKTIKTYSALKADNLLKYFLLVVSAR